jgi:hypothetical protein
MTTVDQLRRLLAGASPDQIAFQYSIAIVSCYGLLQAVIFSEQGRAHDAASPRRPRSGANERARLLYFTLMF